MRFFPLVRAAAFEISDRAEAPETMSSSVLAHGINLDFSRTTRVCAKEFFSASDASNEIFSDPSFSYSLKNLPIVLKLIFPR
jgi:hypothetical protein